MGEDIKITDQNVADAKQSLADDLNEFVDFLGDSQMFPGLRELITERIGELDGD